ncbi:hypothetical protein BpHYR1_006433 [Brachionus plicatilis]|uniref:Uncharacterized protein n=1 Tax=Brachionus plicatilis TaxID=10195 RepID=A0A3M7SXP3_BRAPC|nr:hypothetical protein BpHYR1_006433 [Brachionus plicatilis]
MPNLLIFGSTIKSINNCAFAQLRKQLLINYFKHQVSLINISGMIAYRLEVNFDNQNPNKHNIIRKFIGKYNNRNFDFTFVIFTVLVLKTMVRNQLRKLLRYSLKHNWKLPNGPAKKFLSKTKLKTNIENNEVVDLLNSLGYVDIQGNNLHQTMDKQRQD